MDRDQFHQKFWMYYLMLENKVLITKNYVEFDHANFNVYSNEYASLIQTIGSELDAFFKLYCGFLLDDRKSITHYANHLLLTEPSLTTIELLMFENTLSFLPFSGWSQAQPAKSLQWWDAYTRIKHSRTLNFSYASLENVLNCLGALYILETQYLIKISSLTGGIDIPSEESRLFDYKNSPFKASSMKNVFMVPD